MKLNPKSIITAEKLLNKPFADFDLSDEKDLKTERKKMMEFVTTQIEYV